MSLPVRPRLEHPVLERGGNQIQVGVEADRALVLQTGDAAAARRLRRALSYLDGTHTRDQAARWAGTDPGLVDQALGRLAQARLLHPTLPDPPHVRLIGAGVLGKRFAEACGEAAAERLVVVDPDPPLPELYRYPLATAADSLRAHLADRGVRIATARHWGDPPARPPDVTVIANDRIECDRAITDTLVRNDQPHLFVRPLPDGVVVGPLVVPGRTACTRCIDLTRCADPAWPRMLAQLCRLRWAAPPPAIEWAVATAIVHLRAYAAGDSPATLGATWELRTDDWIPRIRHWPQHPACGCSWTHLG